MKKRNEQQSNLDIPLSHLLFFFSSPPHLFSFAHKLICYIVLFLFFSLHLQHVRTCVRINE